MRKTLFGAIIGLPFVAYVTGCAPQSAGSCSVDNPSGGLNYCVEYTIGYTTAEAMHNCGASPYTADPCPSQDRVGRCSITATMGGGGTQQIVTSFYTTSTATDPRGNCTGRGGEFTAN